MHLGHKGMIKFTHGEDNKPIRPWGRALAEGEEMSPEEEAERIEAHDEAIIANWNAVVAPNDKVECLGDVIIGRSQRHLLGRLNGKKRLRMGNHEVFVKNWNKDYQPYFTEITAYKVFDDLICSHIPLHPESVKERWKANVHGHLHTNRVMMVNPAYRKWDARWMGHGSGPMKRIADRPAFEIIDPTYLCVSMEHIDFTPIPMDEVYARVAAQQEEAAELHGWVRHVPTKK